MNMAAPWRALQRNSSWVLYCGFRAGLRRTGRRLKNTDLPARRALGSGERRDLG